MFYKIILFLFLFTLSFSSYAAILFGIVSDRSAAELAAGAAQFDKKNPGHRIVLRTSSQLDKLSDQEIIQFLEESDAILLAAFFGDGVPRIERLIKNATIKVTVPIFATNSDRRITRLSKFDGNTVFGSLNDKSITKLVRNPNVNINYQQYVNDLIRLYPQQAQWIKVRQFWQGRGSHNMAGLIANLLYIKDKRILLSEPHQQSAIRYYQDGQVVIKKELKFKKDVPLVIVLDYNTGDRAGDRELIDAICTNLEKRNVQCLVLLSQWGEASMQALKNIESVIKPATVNIILSLQDFVIGSGQFRKQVTDIFEKLNVPVIKGIRLTDRTTKEWQLSTDGIPWNGVHYRVAMPELQGITQPMILATASTPYTDKLTGLKLSPSRPVLEQVELATSRMINWIKLQQENNNHKRVAIIYYNHPPGRHNIGADNLDVPASLWQLLNQLKNAGYNTGKLPENQQALLDLIQERGVNLPNNKDALVQMSKKVNSISLTDYQQWFAGLPERIQDEMVYGPLGYLQSSLFSMVEMNKPELGKTLLQHVGGDIDHLLNGIDHPVRERALDLFNQFKQRANELLSGKDTKNIIKRLTKALQATGIEGLRGWGEAPGNVMVYKNKLLVPGIQFGNIFIGPQPPRGWEVNEELLHANLSFPPTHQYLGFYYWIKHQFKADALVHLGRHSTYEFLPQRRVGLTKNDYPTVIASDIPGIYPYIVDGVGEGIQAKRRGLAVMIAHLTPPLRATPLYDDLLRMRQLIESFESSQEKSPTRHRAIQNIRKMIDKMKLRSELETIMKDELKVRGIDFEQVEDEMLVHEVGHYLTQMQERFMPMGLHVFGKDWEQSAIDMMLNSINQPENKNLPALLSDSPAHERNAILAALNGQFIVPGKGNDPIRTPEALPTGRNFHALDSSLIPSRIGYELAIELANQTRNQTTFDPMGREAIILWASDTVRDEGVMVAFGLDMMGIKPVWNSRGKFKGLERLPMKNNRVRRDTVFTTSGLFRDLYSNLLVWLDRAVLLALDGSSQRIISEYPELKDSLNAALQPISEMRQPGNESFEVNELAAHWVQQAKELLKQNMPASQVGRQASLRLFGDAPGSYGAGVNRLVERSASWDKRQQISKSYIMRMGHAYGIGIDGLPAHDMFKRNLINVQNTYIGRSSNLYGLMDNNDVFDYMGGLSMTVESLSGTVPNNRVIQHADPKKAYIQSLDSALLQELRGRFLNPTWIKGLMKHDYAGARTMGSEFLENLWGWQVTNPEIIKSWVWDEVKAVYIDDRHKLGLDKFLEQNHNVHVKTNMLAIMLVAAHKGFWQTDEQTLKELAEQFATLVAEHGLPGSGHTQPNHPMLEWLKTHISVDLANQLSKVQDLARGTISEQAEQNIPVSITQIELSDFDETQQKQKQDTKKNKVDAHELNVEGKVMAWFLLMLIFVIVVSGFVQGRFQLSKNNR